MPARPAMTVESLGDEDRAFVELMAGMYAHLNTMALVYPVGTPKRTAIEAAKLTLVKLSIAAVAPDL